MPGTITERVLYNSADNLSMLSKILTDTNFDIIRVGKESSVSSVETLTTVRVDTKPTSLEDSDPTRYQDIAVRYPRIQTHMAFRSKLPVLQNWVQIQLPKYNRDYTLSDLVEALEELGFNLERRFYKLDKLAGTSYQLRTTPDNPRFMGSVQIRFVESIDPTALPDVTTYAGYDFNITDTEYLMAWANYKTYIFCFTPENSSVISTNQREIAQATIVAKVRIDMNAHIVPNVGIKSYNPSSHVRDFTVTRKTTMDLMDELGLQSYMPLGIGYPVATSWQLIDKINELYDLGITYMDIYDTPIQNNFHTITFKNTCLGFVGSITLDIAGRVGVN